MRSKLYLKIILIGIFVLFLLFSSEVLYLWKNRPYEYHHYRYAAFLILSKQLANWGYSDSSWAWFSRAIQVKFEMKLLERNEPFRELDLTSSLNVMPGWVGEALIHEWQVFDIASLEDKKKAELARMLIQIAQQGERVGDWELVELLAETAIAVAPEWSDYYRYIASFQVKRGNVTEALLWLERCEEVVGNDCEVSYMESLRLLGAVVGGGWVSNFEWDLVEIDEPMTLAYACYSAGLYLTSLHLPQAEQLFKQATVLAPEWSVFWIELANYYYAQGKTTDSLLALDACETYYHPKDHCREYREKWFSTGLPQEVGVYAEEIRNIAQSY